MGRGGNGLVKIDIAERWIIGIDLVDKNERYKTQNVVSLCHAALHEMGHELGLDHSMNIKDIMLPFYNQHRFI